MHTLNYHHLMYFWTVAREGSIARACRLLDVTQPTISAQLQMLEHSFGVRLFRKEGRGIVLTEIGQEAFRHAEAIFAQGRELLNAMARTPQKPRPRFVIGAADVLPKMIVQRLLEPIIRSGTVRLVCVEGKPERLLADMALHEIDLVLSDAPAPPKVRVRAHSHLLGESAIAIYGSPKLAAMYAPGFPGSLNQAPMLLPVEDATLRHHLDRWFEQEGIVPHVVAELGDTALAKVLGQQGLGLLALPSILEGDLQETFGLKPLGRIANLVERVYAITTQRKLKHPAVIDLAAGAEQWFASQTG
ncbi:MAG: LysR family transcriptional regulator [Gemmataceae bacterium]|nr:LysR family transcriptional regulator [Gemmataceae bacterium]